MASESVEIEWHPEILSVSQKRVLEAIGLLIARGQFYLAGGTAVALYLGHRRSVDFDWFTSERMEDPLRLALTLQSEGCILTEVRVERGTLYGSLYGVRMSFIEYRYSLLRSATVWQPYGYPVASLDDLAAMKLSAVAQRGSKKDFVDIYALGLRHRTLSEMVRLYKQKFGVQDASHLLYALAYFDDADKERLPRMRWKVNWRTVKKTILGWLAEVADA